MNSYLAMNEEKGTDFTGKKYSPAFSNYGFVTREVCHSIEYKAEIITKFVPMALISISRTSQFYGKPNYSVTGSIAANKATAYLVLWDNVFDNRIELEESTGRVSLASKGGWGCESSR